MSKLTLLSLVAGLFLSACQPAPKQQNNPETIPGEATSFAAPDNSNPTKPATPKAVESKDFDAFRALFSREFTPYKLGPKSPFDQELLAVKDQLNYLKRSVEARPVAEILFDDETYVSLVTAENPLEDVKVYVWNVFDVEGELLSHKMIAGVEGTDSIFGEFLANGTAIVETYYPGGVDIRGEEVSGKRELTYELVDGSILKE